MSHSLACFLGPGFEAGVFVSPETRATSFAGNQEGAFAFAHRNLRGHRFSGNDLAATTMDRSPLLRARN
jgi:hypothetical protein